MVEKMQQSVETVQDGELVRIPVSKHILGDFEAVETRGQAREFIHQYKMFGYSHIGRVEDFVVCKRIMRLAGSLRAIVSGEQVDPEELRQLGIIDAVKEVNAYIDSHPEGELFRHRDSLGVALGFDEDAVAYADWFKRHARGVRLASHDYTLELGEWDEVDDKLATRGYPPISSADCLKLSPIEPRLWDARMVATCVLDALCRIHLDGIRTETFEGIPRQSADSGIAALWLAMCNEFNLARVMRCEACGRPLIVRGERGVPRRFCDSACTKWAKRNPDKLGQHHPAKDKLL